MTTFKNNAKYAELLLTYLDVAYRGDTPLTVPDVLSIFRWRFKGGSLVETSSNTRLKPQTSTDVYPDGSTEDILRQWPDGKQARALRMLLQRRLRMQKLRGRAVMGRLGSYLTLTSSYGTSEKPKSIYTGMRAIYLTFGLIWEWALKANQDLSWETLSIYTEELMLGACAPSKIHLPTALEAKKRYWAMLSTSRVPALLQAVLHIKELVHTVSSRHAYKVARKMGNNEKVHWIDRAIPGMMHMLELTDPGIETKAILCTLGPLKVRATQESVLIGLGETRLALGKSDLERLHQLVMSATSALVGVVAQSVVGTEDQRLKSIRAVEVAESNITRIVESARKVPLGDEVLVCKGYRRAYTAHLGWLAGSLCTMETMELIREAVETAPKGVLDIEGFLWDAKSLDAASSLNAAKMFKICPAPDVSPASAMMDRITQIGNGNIVEPSMMQPFKAELRAQILRGHIRAMKGRLPLRLATEVPHWHNMYLRGEYDRVPSDEIDTYLAWEGTAKMPDISPYDPSHWKDSGLGADTIWEAEHRPYLGDKSNMMTRLIFDDDCPMPGTMNLNPEHVIKFFVKAEGHKDPARGIFSSNLMDRQAQSWMERAVEKVAISHPSYMIGQEVDVKEAKIVELITRPQKPGWVALYYSFDISGWSAKMPAEPQRISHALWAELYGGHLFKRASELNEGAHIYMNLEGYFGWFKNTHANLEGFNGKEMTMILIALLSLSVKVWRKAVVEQGIISEALSITTTALLFAYIDDGMCRIDLPVAVALRAFTLYKETVIQTFSQCGFSVEVSKCFPSDRFAIFLNEVYLAGRHVVHGVRAAMGISSEPTERHTTLVERVTSVATGCRGAVMAGLNPLSAVLLMGYHTFLHIREWVNERDPVILAVWALTPRTWGGLGLPNAMQMFVSGSGAAFEEGVSTMQSYSRHNETARKVFSALCRVALADRTPTSVMTAPLSSKVEEGYMVDSRVSSYIRRAMQELVVEGRLSRYASRLLKYSDNANFEEYAELIIPIGEKEILQEQMIDNVAEAHPHSIFSAFARRLEKSATLRSVVGRDMFEGILSQNKLDTVTSAQVLRMRALY